MWGTAGEVTFFYEPLHMDVPMLADQQELLSTIQLCADSECSLEERMGVMDDRERWERAAVDDIEEIFFYKHASNHFYLEIYLQNWYNSLFCRNYNFKLLFLQLTFWFLLFLSQTLN